MAQETTSTPYIGSTISLISNMEVRYEGILYDVNSADCTITLVRVRSFGTEDRPTTRPFPYQEAIYENIVFKARDIKDLVVCEPNKQEISDSAILSYSMEVHPPAVKPSSATNSQATRPQVAQMYGGGINSGSNSQSFMGQNLQSFEGWESSNRNRGGAGGRQIQSRPQPLQQQFPPQNFQMGYPRAPRPLMMPGSPTINLIPAPKDRLKFDNDFDFEKANEQFKETNGQKASASKEKTEENASESRGGMTDDEKKGAGEKDDIYYDKRASFFDCISCETREKGDRYNPRPNWKKERQTNEETFGPTAVRSLDVRPRGGGPSHGFLGAGNNGREMPRPAHRFYNTSYNNFGGGYRASRP